MQMRFRFKIVILALFFTLQDIYAGDRQSIHVLSFDEFEPYLHFNNDTIYVINFWATWCSPCRLEVPFLQEVSEDREWERRGLIILAVNLAEPVTVVQQFTEEYRVSFPVLLDAGGEVGVLYNAALLPTTYLIDNNGIIRGVRRGAFSERSHIDQFILNGLMKDE